MSLKEKAKNKTKKQIKKLVFAVIKPFLPFIIIVVLIFLAICTLIDAIFIQEVQAPDSSMPEATAKIKQLCIEKAEYLNTCNNYIGDEKTEYLLDIDSRETDKQIEWSHLYAIMAFHNMANNTKIDENLLEKISKHFESTFKYEKTTIKIETKTKDDEGNETTKTEEKTGYILVESDTIIGHYKYNYEEKTTENGDMKKTGKAFVSEELIGEKYERLKNYLKNELKVDKNDLEYDVQVVIEAANGYYEGKENTAWLQGTTSNATIITDGEKLVPKRYVYVANTRTYKSYIKIWYESTSYNSEHINYIAVLILVPLLEQTLLQWQTVQL